MVSQPNRSRRGRAMLRALVSGLLIALVTILLLAAAPLPKADARFIQPEWVGPVRLVELETGIVLPDRALRLVDGRIAQIVPIGDVPAAARQRMWDAGGAYAVPALADMHAVLTRYAASLEHPLYLAHGVTRLRSILSCPSEHEVSLYACRSEQAGWNRAIRSGGMVGAVTMSSGSFPVTGPARLHPDAPPEFGAGTPAEARALVGFVSTHGSAPDHIKTYDGVPRESFFAMMDEARRRRVEVSGHVPAAISIAEASTAGFRAIAHARALVIGCSGREREIMRLRSAGRPALEWMRLALVTQDEAACRALWSTLKSNGTFVSPTLITRYSETKAGLAELRADAEAQRATPPLFAWLWSEDAAPVEARTANEEAVWAAFYRLAAQRTAEAERAGVAMLVGSDTGDAFVAPGIGLHQEMELWRRAGVPTAAILRAATSGAAAYHRRSDLGRIAPGAVADLVFSDGDPLTNLAALRRPRAVFQEGRLYERPALSEAEGAAEQAAASWRFAARFALDLLRNPFGFAS